MPQAQTEMILGIMAHLVIAKTGCSSAAAHSAVSTTLQQFATETPDRHSTVVIIKNACDLVEAEWRKPVSTARILDARTAQPVVTEASEARHTHADGDCWVPIFVAWAESQGTALDFGGREVPLRLRHILEAAAETGLL